MKVMLSLPDDAVDKLDLIAEQLKLNRSEAVSRLAGNEYERMRMERRVDVLKLVDAAEAHDGRGAQHVAEDRRR